MVSVRRAARSSISRCVPPFFRTPALTLAQDPAPPKTEGAAPSAEAPAAATQPVEPAAAGSEGDEKVKADRERAAAKPLPGAEKIQIVPATRIA